MIRFLRRGRGSHRGSVSIADGDLPEFQELLLYQDRQDRDEDWGCIRITTALAEVPPTIIIILSIVRLLRLTLEQWAPEFINFYTVLPLGLALGVFSFLVAKLLLRRVTHNWMRRRLRRRLRQRGIPVCLRCGYGLSGVTDGTCPECGVKEEGR